LAFAQMRAVLGLEPCGQSCRQRWTYLPHALRLAPGTYDCAAAERPVDRNQNRGAGRAAIGKPGVMPTSPRARYRPSPGRSAQADPPVPRGTRWGDVAFRGRPGPGGAPPTTERGGVVPA